MVTVIPGFRSVMIAFCPFTVISLNRVIVNALVTLSCVCLLLSASSKRRRGYRNSKNNGDDNEQLALHLFLLNKTAWEMKGKVRGICRAFDSLPSRSLGLLACPPMPLGARRLHCAKRRGFD